GELIAFFETNTLRIIRIVNRDWLTGVVLHHGEARHVSRTVADINHIGEWNRRNFRIHVIIHVLRHVEKALINAKEKLRLLGVTDYALRESDAAFVVGRELATENGAHIRREPAAIDQYLHAR